MTSPQKIGVDPARLRPVKEKIKREIREWIVMFLYLWVTFGLFALHQSIMMAEQHQAYRMQGFAIINALILSKVMLIAENLQLAHGRQDSRPIVVILVRSLAFALLFIAFHVLEGVIVGVAHGKTLSESVPAMAGGHLEGIIWLGIIVSVSLVPFFAFREVSRDLGEDRLLRLLVERRRTRIV